MTVELQSLSFTNNELTKIMCVKVILVKLAFNLDSFSRSSVIQDCLPHNNIGPAN